MLYLLIPLIIENIKVQKDKEVQKERSYVVLDIGTSFP
jgi:hypothetical protein